MLEKEINEIKKQKAHDSLCKKVSAATNLLAQINEIQCEHEPNGCFFEVTKKILEMYRYLRFDFLEPVLKTSVDEFQEYGIDFNASTTKEQIECLDFMVALPRDMYCNKNEISSFVKSSAPTSIRKFISLIDSAMKPLEIEDACSAKVLRTYYLNRNKKTKEEVAAELGISVPTFFRKKKIAITKLSILIFGPLGERHPEFSLSRLNKDYHSKLFEIADKIDELFENDSFTIDYSQK